MALREVEVRVSSGCWQESFVKGSLREVQQNVTGRLQLVVAAPEACQNDEAQLTLRNCLCMVQGTWESQKEAETAGGLYRFLRQGYRTCTGLPAEGSHRAPCALQS